VNNAKRPRQVVNRRLPSTLEAVDRLCAELRADLLSAIPCKERFTVELLLREALTNAVVHGLKGEPTGEVRCEIECFPGGITIHVSDNGEGFDWRPRIQASVEPRSESGRGIEILRRYSSRLKFNPKGNSVQVTRVFHKGEENGRS
jgi:serine/threonine-protein kinase RsbW